jgi:serine phosphatase RsbU (regulator of sigma subunit)
VLPFNSIFALLFAYSVFNLKIPKQFWFIVIGFLLSGVFTVYKPVENFIFFQFILLFFSIEAIRIFILSIQQKKEGAKLISSGFVMLILFSLYDWLLDLGLMQPVNNIVNGYPFGFVLLILFISIYLARDFAKINKKILTQEIQAKEFELNQQLLKAEDARKSKELGEARQLQLSMLPHCLPELDGMDICFDMRTATEVGGDYYDYHLTEDGALTIAIGDATGHGMKAGIMVSIIKSLFITHTPHLEILNFFEKCSQTIRQLNFKNLFMSLLIVKIKDLKLTASSAGMPPILIYRNKNKVIDELKMKGLPLGAVESFDYQTVETKLKSGDVLLLMSDGLLELFNEQNDILDDHRVKEIFKNVAENSANNIVNQLFKAADDWRKSRSLNDDLTLVVCKIKQKS